MTIPIHELDLRVVGRVNKTHGVDGELSVTFIDPDIADAIDVDCCLFFKLDGLMVPFFVDAVRPRGNDSLLLSFDGQHSQERASAFVGRDVYMAATDIPEAPDELPDGFYAAQLIGFTAIDTDGSTLGEITDIDDTTDNPLFILTRPDGSSTYVPITDDFIEDIDLDGRNITFDLPEGLLDL